MTATPDARLTQGPREGRPADALRVEGLSLKRGALALDGVDLRVPAGGLATLSGPVGCGKSSLAAAICGVLPVAGGRIAVGGVDVTQLPPERRRVGWVPQDGGLFPRQTAARQIELPLRVRGVRRGERRRRVREVATTWGVDTLSDRTTEELSGGQRRLVAVARAVASEPSLLLLDETLANLDVGERSRTIERLAAWRSDTDGGVLLITHRTDEVPDADARFELASPRQ